MCKDNNYLIDIEWFTRPLLETINRGIRCKYRLPHYGTINYFEVFKVDDHDTPIDRISLVNQAFPDTPSAGRYYWTDETTYKKVREWLDDLDQELRTFAKNNNYIYF